MWSDKGKIEEGKTGWNGGMLDNVHFKPLWTWKTSSESKRW